MDDVRAMRRRDETGSLAAQLAEAQRRVSEVERQLDQQRVHDSVTGLLTMRAFRNRLDADVRRSHRYGRPLGVAMLDIDGFRTLNSNHGYGAGDAVLAAVARTIGTTTRSTDLACRAGGDEFMILLPETGIDRALQAAERILHELETLEAGPIRGISASIGVAGLEQRQTPEELLAGGRTAIERARKAGGGRVIKFEGDHDEVGAETDAQRDVVTALASALLERDRYTGEHSHSVVEMAGRVGEALALNEDDVNRVRTAAVLHDIGKVAIPDEVLHKPGPLDDREWVLMRQHPVIGERILRAIPGLGGVARMVRHEHESWDGSGYPDGLSGEEIPIGSRIILACDAYHAMTSDRPYRAAMSHGDAVRELTANAGKQFDPNVVEVLVGYLYGLRQSGATVA
jgi:diguanylate cyclase (GGDEF)-like protein